MKTASCVLVPLAMGRFLAVSRRNTVLHWCLPGGKTDPGENPLQGAVREFKEEVGLDIDASLLVPIFSGLCPATATVEAHWVTAYLYTGDGEALIANGATPEEGLTLQKLEAAEFIFEDICPFAAFNAFVFAAYAHYCGTSDKSFASTVSVDGEHFAVANQVAGRFKQHEAALANAGAN